MTPSLKDDHHLSDRSGRKVPPLKPLAVLSTIQVKYPVPDGLLNASKGNLRKERHVKSDVGELNLPADYIPSATDVLCGRHKQAFHHSGNLRLREIVARVLPSYLSTTCRRRRSRMITDICNDIDASSGKFLKLSPKHQQWRQISDEEARDKVGHALRDAAAKHYATTGKKKSKKKRSEGPEVDDNQSPSSGKASVNAKSAKRKHQRTVDPEDTSYVHVLNDEIEPSSPKSKKAKVRIINPEVQKSQQNASEVPTVSPWSPKSVASPLMDELPTSRKTFEDVTRRRSYLEMPLMMPL